MLAVAPARVGPLQLSCILAGAGSSQLQQIESLPLGESKENYHNDLVSGLAVVIVALSNCSIDLRLAEGIGAGIVSVKLASQLGAVLGSDAWMHFIAEPIQCSLSHSFRRALVQLFLEPRSLPRSSKDIFNALLV